MRVVDHLLLSEEINSIPLESMALRNACYSVKISVSEEM